MKIDPREIVSDLLQQGAPVCFTAHGPSMFPFILTGDAVKIRPFDPADLKPGAILLYRSTNRLTLHRLVRFDPVSNQCLFTGDAALSGIENIPLTDVIGTAQSMKRRGKTIPLATPTSRWRGKIWLALRPLRRIAARVVCRDRTHLTKY